MTPDTSHTLTLTTETDCMFYLNGVRQLQLFKGMTQEFQLCPGKYTLNFVSIEDPNDNRWVKFEMPAEDTEYDVRFQGNNQKKRKVKERKRIWRALLWIVCSTAVLSAVELGWFVWKTQAPASVKKMENGDLKITVKGITFTMKPVEGGTFQMGSTDGNEFNGEKIVHTVTVSTFYMGETEVTRILWKRLMGSNPSSNNRIGVPAQDISWNMCQDFIMKLNQETGLKFRLPTEAEWEYAARGGKYHNTYKYSGSDNVKLVAGGSSIYKVKEKQANALGLYFMSGNVGEWCEDWFDRNYYSVSPVKDPQGPSAGEERVMRGGGGGDPSDYQVFSRNSYRPDNIWSYFGFRLALTP